MFHQCQRHHPRTLSVYLPKFGNTFNISTSVSSVSAAPNLLVSVDHVDCVIPGCGQPVYVNGAGLKISKYCLMRHQE
ncbi:hypothetical protein C8J56DRAFT_961289 [Mycena floridula]|nr:hypothetical protein C8J56DRAFT_961289 [Mycena floridula]